LPMVRNSFSGHGVTIASDPKPAAARSYGAVAH